MSDQRPATVRRAIHDAITQLTHPDRIAEGYAEDHWFLEAVAILGAAIDDQHPNWQGPEPVSPEGVEPCAVKGCQHERAAHVPMGSADDQYQLCVDCESYHEFVPAVEPQPDEALRKIIEAAVNGTDGAGLGGVPPRNQVVIDHATDAILSLIGEREACSDCAQIHPFHASNPFDALSVDRYYTVAAREEAAGAHPQGDRDPPGVPSMSDEGLRARVQALLWDQPLDDHRDIALIDAILSLIGEREAAAERENGYLRVQIRNANDSMQRGKTIDAQQRLAAVVGELDRESRP